MKQYLGLSALAMAMILGAGAAANATVYITLTEGSTSTQISGAPSAFINGLNFGDYKIVSGFASQEDDLLTSSFTVSSKSAGTHTLTITVLATGETWPTSAANFTSSFAKNGSSLAWSSLSVNTALGAGATTLSLASVDLTSSSGDDITSPNVTPPGIPFSVAAVYTFKSKAASGTNGSLTLSASVDDPPSLPEPGSLALLGSALAGFGIVMRRRRKAA